MIGIAWQKLAEIVLQQGAVFDDRAAMPEAATFIEPPRVYLLARGGFSYNGAWCRQSS